MNLPPHHRNASAPYGACWSRLRMRLLVGVLAVALSAAIVPAAVAQGWWGEPMERTVATARLGVPALGAAPVRWVPPPLMWQKCWAEGYPRLECADLEVPVDYAHPERATLRLRISRLPHQKGREYRGVLVTNPGGPGSSGLGIPTMADLVPRGVGRQYDWIGMDPRGVGASQPALHCDDAYFDGKRPAYQPRNKKQLKRWRKRAKRYAADCGRHNPTELLRNLSTMDTVRDLESLRIALEVDQINFYGFSYGTYLGLAYASTYPHRVGRMVLDGVVDPRRYWYNANRRQNRAFQKSINRFFRWVATHHRTYRLGKKPKQVRHKYRRQLQKLRRQPLARGRLGPSELNDVLRTAAYANDEWPSIATVLRKVIKQGRGWMAYDRYRTENMGVDNSYAAYLAVQCTDQAPRRWKVQRRQARQQHRKHPFLTWNNTWFNAPCLWWAAPVKPRPRFDGAALAAAGVELLLINETFDAATPLSGALTARRMFPTARLIEGRGGTTHAASLSGVACVDNTVARFLNSGALPARKPGNRADKQCRGVPPPRPR